MIFDLQLGDILILMVSATVLFLIVLHFVRKAMANISFTVNITISPAQVPLAALSDPLNLTGTVGQPFSASLGSNVQGGTPPYTINVSGTLPDGLTGDNSGNITGTPSTPGTTTLSVSVSDSAS